MTISGRQQKEDKISVIVPVYRAEHCLRTCLDSLINQTYKNLELILVDDGSPDHSGTICEEYASRDSRIRVLHQKNSGASAARNAGLEAATGEWIGFVDADDNVEPDMYSYLIFLAKQNGSDIAQCGAVCEEPDGSSSVFYGKETRCLPYGAQNFSRSDWKLIGNPVWNKIYRAQTVRNVRFDHAYPIGEDLFFNVQALLKASGVAIGEAVKYHYIQHPDSICHCKPSMERLTSYRGAVKRLLDMFPAGSAAYRHFLIEQLRNDMDICSKLTRFWEPEFEAVCLEIRQELRGYTAVILTDKSLLLRERAKLLMIAWCWKLYQMLLLTSKRKRRA